MADFDLSSATPVSFDLDSATPAKRKVTTTLTKFDPTDGMSTMDKFWAGMGKAPVDLARGTGQMLGLVSRDDVAESRARDAPLMASGAAKAGNLSGSIATLLPTAFIPGANTLAGAGTIGAVSGLLQPSTSTGETLANTGLGAALGPGSLLAGRGAAALGKGAYSAIEPLFQGGQQRILSRTTQAFAGGPQEAAAAAARLQNPGSILPGVQPTSAELGNNAGLAQLERQMGNNPEFLTQLTNRTQANRSAMNSAIGGIAGSDAQMSAAEAARTAASSPLYTAARKASAPLDDEMTALLQRPSMQTAITRAQSLAAENGDSFGLAPTMKYLPTQLSGKDLQYLKMSLADMANSGPQNGMGAHELGAVKGTLGTLNKWITSNVPELKAADAAYASASKPINQMSVGQQLQNKLVPALADFNPDLARTNANAYAGAVRNGDQLAANATGYKGATLSSVLSPQQQQTVQQVGEQLARRAQATDLGRAAGSNTSQNTVSQNVIRQFLGPLGLPQSMADRAASSTLMQSVMRPMQFVGSLGENKVQQGLLEAVLNPDKMAGLLSKPQSAALAKLLWRQQGLLNAPTQALVNSPQQ